ncbi:hypothetical protein B566_EDAN013812 [Ephemera danica]|nr:hypothetical protein B566_EDAN013812 [Ephemera danica]
MVQVYNPITKAVYKNLNRFRETAYGGKFRHDGKLLCAGGDEAQVKLFDDYVRAGAVSPVSTDLVLAGSYDKKVTLLDCRTNIPVLTVDHGAPVESVIFVPTGGMFISAGGSEVCIWDALSGGRLLARIAPHHKTVTCLAMAAGGTRLLSGGLDRRVRITDMSSMQPIHGLDFPSPILSLGVSPGDEVLAVGMVDGLVSVARREETEPVRPKRNKISHPFGRKLPPDPADMELAQQEAAQADIVVTEENESDLARPDHFLRNFRYARALDVAMSPYNQKRRPDIIVALFQELLRRKGVQSALSGRKESSLINILKFITKYIGEFEFMPTLVDVTNIFLEVYEEQLENLPEVARLCETLLQQLSEEEKLTQSLLELQGAMQMLGAAASCVEPAADRPVELEPSHSVSGCVLEVSLS